MANKSYLLILICILVPSIALCEDWPGKSENYGPPHMAYGISHLTCGDYIRGKEKHIKRKQSAYRYLNTWISGYITGLNESLEKGGNVLGKAKIEDFYIMVENYCREYPTEYFSSGIGASLKKLTPVDWKGDKYKNDLN